MQVHKFDLNSQIFVMKTNTYVISVDFILALVLLNRIIQITKPMIHTIATIRRTETTAIPIVPTLLVLLLLLSLASLNSAG